MSDRMPEFVERGFQISCSRCGNEEFAPVVHTGQACIEFRRAGWTVEYPRVFCPQCNVDTGGTGE